MPTAKSERNYNDDKKQIGKKEILFWTKKVRILFL